MKKPKYKNKLDRKRQRFLKRMESKGDFAIRLHELQGLPKKGRRKKRTRSDFMGGTIAYRLR